MLLNTFFKKKERIYVFNHFLTTFKKACWCRSRSAVDPVERPPVPASTSPSINCSWSRAVRFLESVDHLSFRQVQSCQQQLSLNEEPLID
jgi:hypothetical protein